MASGALRDYFGVGVIAARPATPDLYGSTLGLWFATDTGVLSAWDGSDWYNVADVNSLLPVFEPTGGWQQGALLIYDAVLGAFTELPLGAPGDILTAESGGSASFQPNAAGAVLSVNGQTGAVSLAFGDLADVLEPSGGWSDFALLYYDETAGAWAEIPPGAIGEVLTMTIAGPVFVPPTVAPPATGNALGSGGGVAWLGNYDYNVSAANYTIQGVPLTSPETPVTLSAADPTLDRIDIIALTSSGTVDVIEGTPSASPAAPDVDPTTYLQLTFVYVTAASTEPDTFVEDIYLENTEWDTASSGGGWNMASTNNPLSGTTCVEATAVAAASYGQFTLPTATLDLSDFDSLVLYIRSKAAWPNAKSLTLRWYNDAVAVGSPVTVKTGTFGFDSSITTNYQQLVVPAGVFGAGGLDVNRLRVIVAGGGGSIGFYLDNLSLQSGISGVGSGSDAMVFRDAYSGTAQYQRNDVVTTGSGASLKSYVALQAGSGNTPSTSPTFWRQFTPDPTASAVTSVNGLTGAVSLSLEDLDDVLAGTGTPDNGDVLTWDTATGSWVAQQPSGGGAVSSVNGQTGAVSLSLEDLDDVLTATGTPDNGDVLTWDAVAASWVALPLGGGNAIAVQPQGLRLARRWLMADGALRDPLTIGTGAVSVGSATSVVDDTKYNSFPLLRRMHDGRLLMSYQKGDSHNADNTGRIMGRIGVESRTGAVTWGDEFTIYDDASFACVNVGLQVLSTGRIVSSFSIFNYPTPSLDGVRVVYSDDSGNTWSSPVTVNTTFTDFSWCSGSVVELLNGDLIITVEGEDSGDTLSSIRLLRSTDQGATWGSEVVIATGTRNYFEAQAGLLSDGRLMILVRTSAGTGDIYKTFSSDQGATWSTPAVAFSGYGQPNWIELASGTLLALTRRNSDQATIAYTSIDLGVTWSSEVEVDASVMEYACAVELRDTGILVAYSEEVSSTNADIYTRVLTETTTKTGFRGIPQNAQTGNYTCVLADAGRHIYHASGAGAADTYTIPANASVAYEIGTAITFVNMDSNSLAIAITTDTMYLAGTGTTGSRSLAQYGVATAVKLTSTTWLISGSGLT